MISFILLNLIIYIPFHLFEEAVGDFPKWMYEHKWLPYHMTHGHWMANNIFIYYPMLLLAVFIYIFNKNMICFGVAILIWGLRFYMLSDDYSTLHLIIGICIGGLLFGLPIGLCVAAYKFFDKFINLNYSRTSI